MKKQNKSPLNFTNLAASVVSGGGSGSGFGNRDYTMSDWVGEGNNAFDVKGFIDRSNAVESEKISKELAYSTPTSRVQTSYSTVDNNNNAVQPSVSQNTTQYPTQTSTGLTDSSNPFGGRTFTISPAQMKNVENVFGDTNERQASVGENIDQVSENYDAYGEESPLMKKSCGSYKK